MKKHVLAVTAAVLGLAALPALAQSTPAQTNLDPKAARMEARNARGGQLTAVTPEQAQANALQRCARLPAFYKTDCEARVRGEGQASGSVTGGGVLRETVTSMPADQLKRQAEEGGAFTRPDFTQKK